MIRMADMLSQAEIDALLKSGTFTDTANESTVSLSDQEMDALGEIGNISMGTSATTLFTLLGHKVLITTPKVSISTWDELSGDISAPCAAVRIEYTHGLEGSNLLIVKENDVKIITDLMMGGDGSNTAGDLNDLHISAIAEAMNQMIGSSSTSMSELLNKRVDISPPKAFIIDFNTPQPYLSFMNENDIVMIAFKMVVGNLIDSEIMQILPYSFAKKLVGSLLNANTQYDQPESMQKSQTVAVNEGQKQQVNVQPVSFQDLEDTSVRSERKNIKLIMDVPLQITVELGRTNKPIRDILEFGPGSVIELEKLAGEPVDILVNGKNIAKGEVVVIDESFGVRITDIIDPSKRL